MLHAVMSWSTNETKNGGDIHKNIRIKKVRVIKLCYYDRPQKKGVARRI